MLMEKIEVGLQKSLESLQKGSYRFWFVVIIQWKFSTELNIVSKNKKKKKGKLE